MFTDPKIMCCSPLSWLNIWEDFPLFLTYFVNFQDVTSQPLYSLVGVRCVSSTIPCFRAGHAAYVCMFVIRIICILCVARILALTWHKQMVIPMFYLWHKEILNVLFITMCVHMAIRFVVTWHKLMVRRFIYGIKKSKCPSYYHLRMYGYLLCCYRIL